MRPLLLIVSLLGLLMTPASYPSAGAAAGFQQRKQQASRARSDAAEIASIEAYGKGLDQYFKSHPQSTRYFVDALPEGNAESTPELGKVWHEVKTESEMLEAEGAYANHSIVVSMKDGQIVYADIAEPREHHRYDHRYYFRNDGTLAKIDSEFYGNIAERHLSRESFYNANGKLLRTTSQCFRIITTSRGSSEKPVSCRRDSLSAEYGNYQLPVYKRNVNLPGYDLLKKR